MDGCFVERSDRWIDGRKYLVDGDRLRVMKFMEEPEHFVIIVYHHQEGRFSQHMDLFLDRRIAQETLTWHRKQAYLEDTDWSDQTARWEHLRPELDAPVPGGPHSELDASGKGRLRNFFMRSCR